jgi:hypothetical protein
LVALSPVIVIATCDAELPGRLFVKSNPASDVVTDRVVVVSRVLKGTLGAQDRIAIEELGGTLGAGSEIVRHISVRDLVPLEVGKRYLLFLRPSSQLVNDEFDGRRFTITGVWAGSFRLVGGKVEVSKAAEPGLREMDNLPESDVLERVAKEVGR